MSGLTDLQHIPKGISTLVILLHHNFPGWREMPILANIDMIYYSTATRLSLLQLPLDDFCNSTAFEPRSRPVGEEEARVLAPEI